MQTDTQTRKKIPHSSLCKQVNLSVPASWGELTQQQLRYVIMLMYEFQDQRDGFTLLKWYALQNFAGFRFLRKKDIGWLCEFEKGKDSFIIAHELLPDILKSVAWLEHPEEMTVRIEEIDKHKATDFLLQEFEFGYYLQAENFYQSYLNSRDEIYLAKMARLLYNVADGESLTVAPYKLLAVFLWYTAVKKRFAQQFHHFFKPAQQGQDTGSRQSQYEMVTMQIRLLTKGDVTKNNEIMKASTWDALAELDAQAREAEEIKMKYGKKHV